MNGSDFLKHLTECGNGGTLKDMPVSISVGKSDAVAAKLLLWLAEQMPPDSTSQDVHDVLDSAKWWQTLLETMSFSSKKGTK